MTEHHLPVAGEEEGLPDGEAHPSPAPQVPVQEGQPTQPKARRNRRTQKPTQEVAVRLNPACSNPACVVTCSPNCENLHDYQDYNEFKRWQREQEMGSDPTLRSKDVM